MIYERDYKGIFWILMKHDHANLRVKRCSGQTHLAKLIKLAIPIFFVLQDSKNKFFYMEQKFFFYGTKIKRKFYRCI